MFILRFGVYLDFLLAAIANRFCLRHQWLRGNVNKFVLGLLEQDLFTSSSDPSAPSASSLNLHYFGCFFFSFNVFLCFLGGT